MPSALSVQTPLSLVLVELLQQRFESSSQNPLVEMSKRRTVSDSPTLSEQALLLFAMIDVLPSLDVDSLREWLPTIATDLRAIKSSRDEMKSCQRFWEVLNSGEMDFDRAAVCGRWWNSEGGRQSLVSLYPYESRMSSASVDR